MQHQEDIINFNQEMEEENRQLQATMGFTTFKMKKKIDEEWSPNFWEQELYEHQKMINASRYDENYEDYPSDMEETDQDYPSDMEETDQDYPSDMEETDQDYESEEEEYENEVGKNLEELKNEIRKLTETVKNILIIGVMLAIIRTII